MKTFSRRDMLKTSLLAPAAVAAAHTIGPMGAAMEAPPEPLFEAPLRDADDARDRASTTDGARRANSCPPETQ